MSILKLLKRTERLLLDYLKSSFDLPERRLLQKCGYSHKLFLCFRCGNNFCASHRYAETHSCTYDYKSAGRRYLQEANPVVNAPKLPKI